VYTPRPACVVAVNGRHQQAANNFTVKDVSSAVIGTSTRQQAHLTNHGLSSKELFSRPRASLSDFVHCIQTLWKL